MAAMIFRDRCVFEVSLECVNKEVYLHAPTEFNVIASQITHYKLCIVGQRRK